MGEQRRLHWCPKQGVIRADKGADNRGVTLVELIVAVAILGFLTVILSSFLRTGGVLYNRVSGNLSLQVQSQLALAQLQEYIVDADGGLYFDRISDITKPALYVMDYTEDDGGAPTLNCHVFWLDTTQNMLYYKYEELLAGGGLPALTGGGEMAGNITQFSVSLTPESASEESWSLSRLSVSLSFSLLNSTYQGEMVLAPRNRPLTASDPDVLTGVLIGALSAEAD